MVQILIWNLPVPRPEQLFEKRIGLNSLRRQLKLLHTDYHIAIEDSETRFTIEININKVSYANVSVHHCRR